MKKWKRQRETVQRRERGEGVDNMFPLLRDTEGNNMITATLTCSKHNSDSLKCSGRRRLVKRNAANGSFQLQIKSFFPN